MKNRNFCCGFGSFFDLEHDPHLLFVQQLNIPHWEFDQRYTYLHQYLTRPSIIKSKQGKKAGKTKTRKRLLVFTCSFRFYSSRSTKPKVCYGHRSFIVSLYCRFGTASIVYVGEFAVCYVIPTSLLTFLGFLSYPFPFSSSLLHLSDHSNHH